MYARVILGKINPEKQEDATKTYRESVVPAAKQQPGYKGAYLMGDPKNSGKFITITFWDNEENMNKGEASGYVQEQLGKVAAHFIEQPTIDHYEVSVQDIPQ